MKLTFSQAHLLHIQF